MGIETDDLLDSLTTRIAKRYALPVTTARSVVELYRSELANKREPVALMMLVRIAQSGINFGMPLTRRPRKQDSDDEC